jgi:hypothetical protein
MASVFYSCMERYQFMWMKSDVFAKESGSDG